MKKNALTYNPDAWKQLVAQSRDLPILPAPERWPTLEERLKALPTLEDIIIKVKKTTP